MSKFKVLVQLKALANTHVTQQKADEIYSKVKSQLAELQDKINSYSWLLSEEQDECEQLRVALQELEERFDVHESYNNPLGSIAIERLFNNLHRIPIDKLEAFIKDYE